MAYSKRFRILFGCALLISLAVLAAPSAQLYGDGQPRLEQVAQSSREGAAQPAPPLELMAQLVRVSQPSSTTTGRNLVAAQSSVRTETRQSPMRPPPRPARRIDSKSTYPPIRHF